MDEATSEAITQGLKQLINAIAPDIRYVAKYGGEVLAHVPGDDSKFLGGVFVYKGYVTFEISEGEGLDDPGGHLEGKGKKRRHLKFETLDDIAGKDTESYLKQMFA